MVLWSLFFFHSQHRAGASCFNSQGEGCGANSLKHERCARSQKGVCVCVGRVNDGRCVAPRPLRVKPAVAPAARADRPSLRPHAPTGRRSGRTRTPCRLGRRRPSFLLSSRRRGSFAVAGVTARAPVGTAALTPGTARLFRTPAALARARSAALGAAARALGRVGGAAVALGDTAAGRHDVGVCVCGGGGKRGLSVAGKGGSEKWNCALTRLAGVAVVCFALRASRHPNSHHPVPRPAKQERVRQRRASGRGQGGGARAAGEVPGRSASRAPRMSSHNRLQPPALARCHPWAGALVQGCDTGAGGGGEGGRDVLGRARPAQ